MGTIDYGPTPIQRLTRSQMETAYIAAVETRDRALRQRDLARNVATSLEAELAAIRDALLEGGQDGQSRARNALRILAGDQR